MLRVSRTLAERGALDQLRWQELFDASVADMRSLLEFARPYDAGFLSEVLSGDEASLTVACFMEEYAEPVNDNGTLYGIN